MPYAGPWVVEFRSGSHFQNLEADHGGPIETAQEFRTMEDAEDFMDANDWMWLHGGMAKPKFRDG